MNTALWTIVAALLAYSTVIAHEAAHAITMRRNNIRVAEVGAGIPIPPRIVLTGRRPYRISISPWLIMAYVRVHDDDHDALTRLPYRDQAWIYGSGVTVNITLGLGALTIANAIQGRWTAAASTAGIATLVWTARRPFVSYVLPALAVPALGFIIWSLSAPLRTTATAYSQTILDLLPTGPLDALVLAGVVSLVLGISNLLPFPIFDGGKIVHVLLHRWLGDPTACRISNITAMAGLAIIAADLAFTAWLIIG